MHPEINEERCTHVRRPAIMFVNGIIRESVDSSPSLFAGTNRPRCLSFFVYRSSSGSLRRVRRLAPFNLALKSCTLRAPRSAAEEEAIGGPGRLDLDHSLRLHLHKPGAGVFLTTNIQVTEEESKFLDFSNIAMVCKRSSIWLQVIQKISELFAPTIRR